MRKDDVPRVPPAETRRRVDRGAALLVCGYEADEKFAAFHLEGAWSLNQLLARLPGIPPEQELIFYCA